MSHRPKTSHLTRLLLAHICALTLGLAHASAQAVKPVPPATTTPTQPQPQTTVAAPTTTDEDLVQLGVFEVSASKRGYYQDTTMAGTRISSNIEDLGSSITVITTEQMDDFGMIDINDIFNFEVGTEGAATFSDVSIDNNGNATDGNMSDPGGSNRVRGIGKPNRTFGNFEVSRMGFDRLLIRGSEIIRGPSSIIAGLGNPAGTINAIPIAPNLTKNISEVRLRVDSDNSFRETLDLSRVLIRNKLAVRAQQAYRHIGYERKPSGVDGEIYNFMVKYQPFRKTTFDVTYTRLREFGNRANMLTPGDGITPWRQRGEYTWDPLEPNTGSVGPTTAWGAAYDKNGNKIIGTPNTAYMTNNGGLARMWQSSGRGTSLIFVDRDGATTWMAPRPTGTDNAFANDQTGYNYAMASQNPVLDPTMPTPLQPTAVWGVSDKNIYDWTRTNIAATDRFYGDDNVILARLTQTLLDTPSQYLAIELGWFREDSDTNSKALMGKSKKNTTSSYLAIDVNRKLYDGSDNPNYLRPYLAVNQDLVNESPLLNDTYRAQLAYKLDFRRNNNWSRWLGLNTVTAYAEYKQFETENYNYRHAIISDHPTWQSPLANHTFSQGARPGDPRGTSSITGAANTGLVQDQLSAFETRNYAFYYIGDAIGQNIDYSPGTLATGQYSYIWGNAATRLFNRTPTQLGLAADLAGSGGANNNMKITKGAGVVLQSHLLKDGIVITLGARRDTVYQKDGVPPRMMPDGITFDYAYNSRWMADWRENSGTTRAEGVVLKPAAWIKDNSPRWLRPLRYISFFYNQSSSLDLNVDVSYNLQGESLPNPTGTGKDYGVNLKLLNDRLIVRFNRYENYTKNQRGTAAPVGRILNLDIYEANYDGDEDEASWEDQTATRRFGLNRVATQWVKQMALMSGETLTETEIFHRVADIMHMTPERLYTMQHDRPRIRETDEGLASGYELSVTWMPTDYLQFRINASKAEAKNNNVAPGYAAYLEERLDFWQNLIDPITGARWWTSIYDPERPQTAEQWYNASVKPDWDLAKAMEGMPQPNISKYIFAIMGNLKLSGLTKHRILRGVSLSAAARWQSPVSIGNYGIDVDGPDPVTGQIVHTARDPNNVIWGKTITYVTCSIGYKTKVFNGKIPAEFLLFANNILEDGGLRAVRANTNGTPTVFRIVDPRTFGIEARFSF